MSDADGDQSSYTGIRQLPVLNHKHSIGSKGRFAVWQTAVCLQSSA